ncbi:MAG: hypothetical protein COA94_04955 [Rickettsiales bacterium]|nr:MAG: hypothetical protein COA94_04955 [Rickettsiales bacterium]
MAQFEIKTRRIRNLTEELNEFFSDNGLPPGSADEVLIDKEIELTTWQQAYLLNFIERWNKELLI